MFREVSHASHLVINLFVHQPITYFLTSPVGLVNERTFRENGPSGPGDGGWSTTTWIHRPVHFFFFLSFVFSFFHGGTKGQPRRLSKSHVRRLDRVALVRNNHESGARSALGQPRLIVLEWFGSDARSTDRQRVREIPISWTGIQIVFFLLRERILRLIE